MNAMQVEFGELEIAADDIELFEMLAETGDGPPVEATERSAG